MTNELSTPVDDRDHVTGSQDAPVVLVQYGDYQCANSAAVYPVVKELRRRFGDDLCFVFRNFPLIHLHRHALRAAVTVEWAAGQGRFWEIHDHLFTHRQALDARSLLAAVAELGMSRSGLRAAWDDQKLFDRVVDDIESGVTSGVHGTPTFFVNGQRLTGPVGVERFARIIRAAIARHHQSRFVESR